MKNNMKKIASFGLLLVLSAGGLLACAPQGEGKDTSSQETSVKQSIIDLRSATNQKLKVGEEMTIVYLLKDSKKEVGFRSENESVATVDDFGGVTGVGEGETDIIVYVIGDESDSVKVHFTVKKSFFVYSKGLYNGQVDFSSEDEGLVKAKGDQVQMLVNEKGQQWYFKAHIKRTGSTNGDTGGRWGVGSFLVDKDHPIGNNMFWFGFRRPGGGADMDVTPYYGGWRYAKNLLQNETDIDSSFTYDATNGVDVEIIRSGKMHYFTWTTEVAGHEKVKMGYSVPFFEDQDTYPGVYSQNQLLDVTDFSSSSDPSFINEKLDEFQKAESLDINCIDNRLINGKTYQLSSTVLPEVTPNKSVSYSLTKEVSGVSLTEDGSLTIEKGFTGEFRVTAFAKNNPLAKQTKKFQAIDEPAKGDDYINEGMVKLDRGSKASGRSIEVAFGNNYVPLNAKGSSWVASIQVSGLDGQKEGTLGILSAQDGYMDYFQNAFSYDLSSNARNLLSKRLGEESYSMAYARAASALVGKTYEMTVIKQGDKQYVAVDGKLLGVYDAPLGETTPVVFANGVPAKITVANLKVGEEEASSALKAHRFFTGGNVEKSGDVYDLAAMDFSGSDMNWPPVNGFANGVKVKEVMEGDFDVSFRLSNLSPLESGGKLDGKVLVYLDSSNPTCSLQLVIKGTKDNPTYALCPNYDDATWQEYSLSGYGIDFSKEVEVKIEKREEGCKVYFNGVSVLEGSPALANNGDWDVNRPMIPGIGTFRCGARLSNPKIEMAKGE